MRILPVRKQGCAQALLWIAGALAIIELISTLISRPLLRDLQHVAAALAGKTPAPTHVAFSDGEMFVTIDTILPTPPDSVRAVARRLASIAYFSFRDSTRVSSVTVTFRSIARNGPLTTTRAGPTFHWFNYQLESGPQRSHGGV